MLTAELAYGLVAPEPSTWAMMLFGFAGLGFAGWRARRAAARAPRLDFGAATGSRPQSQPSPPERAPTAGFTKRTRRSPAADLRAALFR